MTEGYNSDEDRWPPANEDTENTPISERLWNAWNKLEDALDTVLQNDAFAAERNELFKVVKEIHFAPPPLYFGMDPAALDADHTYRPGRWYPLDGVPSGWQPTLSHEPTVTAQEAAKHSVTESEVTELPSFEVLDDVTVAVEVRAFGKHIGSYYYGGYLFDFYHYNDRTHIIPDPHYFDPEDAPYHFDQEDFLEEVLREVDERISEALWDQNDARLGQRAADQTW